MRLALCLLALVALVACGGSDSASEESSKQESQHSSQAKSGETDAAERSNDDPVSGLEGKPRPSALSDFQCRHNDGTWNASGTLHNRGDKAATFQVTVVIAAEDAEDTHEATTKQFASIQPKDTAGVELKDLKAPDDGESCYVQVLESKG